MLDLGCGPGLYSSRLAALGHECTGIDYSPASIEYATRTASEEHLQCTYRLEDIRTAEYGTGFGLAMLIYGELNIFRADDAALILHKAYDALDPGGILLLEPHTVAAVQAQGKQGCTWRSAQTGLFSDEPHVYLTEGTWSDSSRTATVRYFVVDASTGDVIRHAQTFQAYTGAEYRTVLEEQGFRDVTFFASLGGEETDELAGELFAATARKL